MKKQTWIAVLFLLTALLISCTSGAKPEGDNTPTTEPQTAPVAHPPTEEAAKDTILSATPITDPTCVAQEPKPTPPAEILETFSHTEGDWVKGPEDAAVTIVEYGDFQ